MREPREPRAGGGFDAPLNLPWLGAAVAVLGLVLLWTATGSFAWIDSGGTMTLSELGATAEALGQFRVVRWYADWGWKLLVAYVVLVATLATLVNPTSRGLRTLLWLPLAGPFALFNLTDGKGRAAPRVLGVLCMLAPAALLGVVWVDMLVEPELDPQIDPQVEVPVDGSLPDPETLDPETLQDLQDLQASGDPGSVDLGTLEDLGLDWRGFTTDEIGNGLWMSFAGLAVVAAGAALGTRAAGR